MSNTRIPNGQLLELAAEVKEHIDLSTLEEGLECFKKCMVKKVTVDASGISSFVQEGNYFYTARINLNDFTQSTCSCLEGGNCKHLAATFFNLYSHYQWPSVFLAECADKQQEPQLELRQAKLPPKITPPDQLSPNGPVEVWYNYFEQAYKKQAKENDQYYRHWDFELICNQQLYKLLIDFRQKTLPRCKLWGDKKSARYRFHNNLFILTQLERINQQHPNLTFALHVFRQFEEDLTDELFYAVVEEESETFLQKSLKVIWDNLQFEKAYLFNWLYIYRLIWSGLFKQPERVQKEIAFLKKQLAQNEPGSRVYYAAAMILAHFRILENKDEEARVILNQLNNLEIVDLENYLITFANGDEWDRLLEWLRWLTPVVTNAFDYDPQLLCKLWEDIDTFAGAREEMLQAFKDWLPRSYRFYDLYLFDSEDYKAWADLQISCWSDFIELTSLEELRIVEKAAPSALLPLYHQWAVRLIEEKNRKAYKEAVKILKKLRSLYKKVKQADKFENFIRLLTARYSRYRALQEELQKGTLIS